MVEDRTDGGGQDGWWRIGWMVEDMMDGGGQDGWWRRLPTTMAHATMAHRIYEP